MTDEHDKIQEWCPNCEHFRKHQPRDSFLNGCDLTGWSEYPLDCGDQAVVAWQKVNWNDVTHVRIDADDCPGFVPYAELAQKIWLRCNRP